MSMRIDFSSKDIGIFKKYSWTRASTQWMDEVAPLVVDAIKKEAPVRRGPGGGRLRDSITYRKHVGLTGVGLEFGSRVPYASYVEDGTPAHLIYPRNANVLRFIGRGGDVVFSTVVAHPGTRPNPFARNAVMRMTPYLQRSFQESVESQFRSL